MMVSLSVFGQPLLGLYFSRDSADDVEPEPERRIGFYGGAGLFAERAETADGVGDGSRTRSSAQATRCAAVNTSPTR
jgi:hypothetical protein